MELIGELMPWKALLQCIRVDYEEPFHFLFGPCQRFWMPTYRAFLRAIDNMQSSLEKLLDLLRTVDDHPARLYDDVVDASVAIERWTRSAARQYIDMTAGRGRDCVATGMSWKTKSRRRMAFARSGS